MSEHAARDVRAVKRMERNVLIIENDEYTAQKVDEYLKALGFTPTIARSGQIGLVSLRTQRPDLILFTHRLQDMDAASFLERINKVRDMTGVPIIIFTQKEREEELRPLLKKDLIDFIPKPVMLEKLRKKVFRLLKLPEPVSGKHLTAEVFIRDGIVVAEVRGSLIEHEITALKYWILDTARANQTLSKRFYIIIYRLDEEVIPQPLFDKLFDFVYYFPHLPRSHVNILTAEKNIRESIKKSRIASEYTVVDSYIEGLNALKSLYLAQGEYEIPVEYLVPNTALYRNVYDSKGKLIKEEGKSFSQEELQALLRRGIKKLYYSRKARIDEDRQIDKNEDVDVVMDAIQVTGIMVPNDFKELFHEQEAKKRFTMNVLIVNSNRENLRAISDFFIKKGFPTVQVSSIRRALECAAQMLFESVVVDLELEGGSGLALVKTMKLQPTMKSAQFILTGQTVKKQDVEQAIQLGVRGFLKAPFNFDKLEPLIS